MEASISYALDLVIRLLDTTTGYPITEHQVIFYENGRPVTYIRKDDGLYVAMNIGRVDKRLRVKVKGFLEEEVQVCYAELQEKLPEIYINLIPEQPAYGYTDLLELKGNHPGIESITAISMTEAYASAQAYQEKKQQLKIFVSKRLTETAYALVHNDAETFEEFHILPVKNKQVLRLKAPLQTSCKPEEIVTRIIRGRTIGSGDYLLRVRGDEHGTDYLVCYVVNGQKNFKRIAFQEEEQRRL